MTLLNGLLAFGAIAFTIPLVIHLLHRSRFRTVDWGAMHLLESVVRINRRRMQISNLLLLLLRCLIPVLLAFCLARPVFTGFQMLPGDAPQSLILVIDDSRSMSAASINESPRIEKAKNELLELLREMSRRDEVILVLASSIDAPPATMGVSDAVNRIRNIRATGGPVDAGRLAGAAIEAVSQASNPQQRILVVSDFQSHMFGQGAMESLARLSTAIADQKPGPVVGFWNFGIDSDELSNVSINSVSVDSPAVVAGRSTQYSARLNNASDNPVVDLRVIWSINGQALEPRLTSIEPRSSATARLNHRIDEAGVYEVTVSVEHGDALSADNRRSISVNVMREINVLLVDGRPSNLPLESETDFLAIALSPFAFGGDDQPDAVRTSVVPTGRMIQALEKSPPEVVVLANVRGLTDDAKSQLARFVLAGGALVVFDGDQVKPEEFNTPWTCDQGTVPMPAVIGDLVGQPTEGEGNVARIGELNPQFTPWQLLAPGDERPLSEVEVRTYRQLTPAVDDVNDAGTSVADENASVVLLSMVGGDPIVVAAQRGRGQIVQFAIPCDAAWTSLPMRMVYLPMMQQLVLDLAGKTKATTIDVGQPITVPLQEFAVLSDADVEPSPSNQNVSYTIEIPGGKEVSLTATNDAAPRLTWAETRQPGAYRFRRLIKAEQAGAAPAGAAPAGAEQAGAEPAIAATLRVLEVPEIESQLRDVPADRLSSAAEQIEGTVYTNLSDIRSDDRVRRFGREIWRWLLAGLLLFLLLELFVQQRLVRATMPAGPS